MTIGGLSESKSCDSLLEPGPEEDGVRGHAPQVSCPLIGQHSQYSPLIGYQCCNGSGHASCHGREKLAPSYCSRSESDNRIVEIDLC